MIQTLAFGRTGHESSRAIFGGAGLSSVTQAEADRALEHLLAFGVNHLDVAASYGDAELRVGPWMPEHRGRFFLATKTGEREYAPARDQIRRSLERLRVDRVDLLQLHNLVDEREWEVALGPGGALEAAIEARDEGLVRFIGVTGHGLAVARRHLQSLERFDFDSVLLPYSHILMRDEGYARDYEALTASCERRGVAIQTIKAITRRPWGDGGQRGPTWYEPLQDQADIDAAVHWVMGRSGVHLCTAGDLALLPKVLSAAERFEARPSDARMAGVLRDREMAPLFTD
jgi:aryl-alcohol dehydrogenase-like predicted oxidoreductase